MSCTGIAASWCPECGTCTCVSPEDTINGNYRVDPACPLHGDDSKHAERPDLFDVIEEAAADLEADGVLVSFEEFRRNLASWEE